MALYPIKCNKCNIAGEVLGDRKCPICSNLCGIDWTKCKPAIKIGKEVIIDHFESGKGSINDPMIVTSERKIKEEYKKRGISYIS